MHQRRHVSRGSTKKEKKKRGETNGNQRDVPIRVRLSRDSSWLCKWSEQRCSNDSIDTVCWPEWQRTRTSGLQRIDVDWNEKQILPWRRTDWRVDRCRVWIPLEAVMCIWTFIAARRRYYVDSAHALQYHCCECACSEGGRSFQIRWTLHHLPVRLTSAACVLDKIIQESTRLPHLFEPCYWQQSVKYVIILHLTSFFR